MRAALRCRRCRSRAFRSLFRVRPSKKPPSMLSSRPSSWGLVPREGMGESSPAMDNAGVLAREDDEAGAGGGGVKKLPWFVVDDDDGGVSRE
jgi:hypothetical protein